MSIFVLSKQTNMTKKKTAKKNGKKVTYTRIGKNLYRDSYGNIRGRKMIDGVSYSCYVSTIKEAKAYLNTL